MRLFHKRCMGPVTLWLDGWAPYHLIFPSSWAFLQGQLWAVHCNYWPPPPLNGYLMACQPLRGYGSDKLNRFVLSIIRYLKLWAYPALTIFLLVLSLSAHMANFIHCLLWSLGSESEQSVKSWIIPSKKDGWRTILMSPRCHCFLYHQPLSAPDNTLAEILSRVVENP